MNNISDSKEELCRQFVECNNYPKYILGRNPFAQSVLQVFSSKRFTINGIVDEFTTDEFFGGVPIVHSISKLSADAIVLSAALLNPVTVKRKLCGAGVRNIDYFSLLHFYPEFPIKQICFWEGFHNSFANRHNEYEAIYECLADKKSKDIYNRIIDFRLNYNIDAMDIFSDRQKEQYFEPFLNLSAGFSFVDIGGFDGYTTKQFIEVCPNYNNIWFFEPEEHNLVVAKELLKEHPQITYCQVAASDKVTELRFEPSNDASKITENGSVTVKAQLIDNIIPQDSKNLFIKMDIEGAESQAIAGAVKTIRNCHPTMAISVYHKGADFIDIPKQIFSIRDDYNIYLRHYTEGISETIMFFVPKG